MRPAWHDVAMDQGDPEKPIVVHHGRPLRAEGRAGPVDTRLAEPPRRIPAAFWFAELVPFRWRYIGILFAAAMVPVFVARPHWPVLAAGAVLMLLGIYAFQLWGTANRLALLKWGQVAQVSETQILSRGRLYRGATWRNAPLPIANRWKVTRPLYSGPNTRTEVRYSVNGYEGRLVLSGREYTDGVVLADPRKPARALCVTSFAYDLDRDDAGNWIGRIRPRLKVGMAVWSGIVIGWLALAAVAARHV